MAEADFFISTCLALCAFVFNLKSQKRKIELGHSLETKYLNQMGFNLKFEYFNNV